MATTLARKLSSVPIASSIDAVPPVLPEEEAPLPLTLEERAFVRHRFAQIVCQFPDLRMELTAEGEVVIMAPAHSETGRNNFKLAARLARWIESGGGGEGFDSSSGFTLPDGAIISPDVAWVAASRWQALPSARRKGYAFIVPDFVIELRSGSDRLSTLQKKMRQYIVSGVQLGWLIDPRLKRVEIYQPSQDVQILLNPQAITACPLLPGFTLDLSDIFA